MLKYLLKRILRGIISIIIVVGIVMILIYSLMDRDLIFAQDNKYNKVVSNDKIVYKYEQWEIYGYIDYVTYNDYINELERNGEISSIDAATVKKLPDFDTQDSGVTKEYIDKFTDYYKSKGYEVTRLKADKLSAKKYVGNTAGYPRLFAFKDKPVIGRLGKYLASLFVIDNKYNAKGIPDEERKIYFTFNDPVYGGSFAPAIMGNGTYHKYLLYFDSEFPFIHQNLFDISLGVSYSVNRGVDVFQTMTESQGDLVKSTVVYPTGYTEESSIDLHSLTYVEGSSSAGNSFIDLRFTDDYTNYNSHLKGRSKMGYSFIIGIISVIIAYILAIPLGLLMARHKEKLIDKIGTVYIIFIIAVPSLAYIFMFKAIGSALFGLPTTFNTDSASVTMYILPIVSLALPSIANLMKWMRRYMIDQMNSDYVKFARSGGLSETEIFSKHILKNALIPIVHGIPAAVLGSLVGAIITERVYVVPGVGNVLTKAINAYDNSVIVGVTLFYAVLSVTAVILGDIFMTMVDPRISFSDKGR